MGKQMSKASVKISKNYNESLKPRVYITHSSSFKTLVQELTGKNGAPQPSSIVSTISSPPSEVGFEIKQKDQDTLNDCKSFVPETGNLIDVMQDMNMESWLLEVDPLACLIDETFS